MPGHIYMDRSDGDIVLTDRVKVGTGAGVTTLTGSANPVTGLAPRAGHGNGSLGTITMAQASHPESRDLFPGYIGDVHVKNATGAESQRVFAFQQHPDNPCGGFVMKAPFIDQ